MKKLIFFLLVLISCNTIAEFIHPMEFDGSDAQKTEVIEYIINNVKHDYCESGLDMCSYTNIWMMYKKNIEAVNQSLSW